MYMNSVIDNVSIDRVATVDASSRGGDVYVTVLSVSILILYAPTGLLCGKSQAKYTTKFSIYLILF